LARLDAAGGVASPRSGTVFTSISPQATPSSRAARPRQRQTFAVARRCNFEC